MRIVAGQHGARVNVSAGSVIVTNDGSVLLDEPDVEVVQNGPPEVCPEGGWEQHCRKLVNDLNAAETQRNALQERCKELEQNVSDLEGERDRLRELRQKLDPHGAYSTPLPPPTTDTIQQPEDGFPERVAAARDRALLAMGAEQPEVVAEARRQIAPQPKPRQKLDLDGASPPLPPSTTDTIWPPETGPSLGPPPTGVIDLHHKELDDKISELRRMVQKIEARLGGVQMSLNADNTSKKLRDFQSQYEHDAGENARDDLRLDRRQQEMSEQIDKIDQRLLELERKRPLDLQIERARAKVPPGTRDEDMPDGTMEDDYIVKPATASAMQKAQARLGRDLARTDSEVSDLQQQIHNLKRAADTNADAYAKGADAVTETLNAIDKRLLAVEACQARESGNGLSLWGLRSRVESLEQARKDLVEAHNSIKDRTMALETRVGKAELRFDSLEQASEEATKDRDAQVGFIRDLQNRTEDLSTRLQAIETYAKRVDTGLSKRLKSVEQQIENLEKDRDSITQSIGTLEVWEEDSRRYINTYESNFRSIRAELDKLNTWSSRLHDMLHSLKDCTDGLDTKLQAIETNTTGR